MNNYKIKIILMIISVVLFLTAFFSNPAVMGEGVRSGLTVCGTTVIPSLFPFVVLSDFLIRSGLCSCIGNKLSWLTEKVFALPGAASCVILMSLIGGFPVGAKMTAQLVESGELTKNEGRRMMLFCVNGGPAFIIGAVGTSMLSSAKAGIVLYASLVFTSLFTGFLSRFLAHRKPVARQTKKVVPDGGALIKSVSEGTATMLNISAWILLFSCVSGYCALLPVSNSTVMWINMISEVTKGSMAAVSNFPTCVMALVIGWSGLAVHCQIYQFVRSTGLPFLRFMLSRLFNGGVATAVAWLLFKLFPCETGVFSNVGTVLPQAYSVSVPAAVAMLVLGAFTVLDIDLARSKKV